MSAKTKLQDLKVKQCFTFPEFSTVYYVLRQIPECNRTHISMVNKFNAESQEGSIFVQSVSSDSL
jgi:hypothetical protein